MGVLCVEPLGTKREFLGRALLKFFFRIDRQALDFRDYEIVASAAVGRSLDGMVS
jgi:hypothetical protein